MTDERFAEVFTTDLIVRIKNKEPQALSKVYFENYDIFKAYAFSQMRADNFKFELDCYLNDIYVSLPYMNYSNVKLFFNDLKHVLNYVKFDGYFYIRENNSKRLSSSYISLCSVQSLYFVNDEGEEGNIADFLCEPSPSAEEAYFNNLQNDNFFKIKKTLDVLYTFLTPTQLKVFKLYIKGYSYSVIARILSKSRQWVRATMEGIRRNFARNYEKFRDSLKFLIGDNEKKYESIMFERLLKFEVSHKKSLENQRKRKAAI